MRGAAPAHRPPVYSSSSRSARYCTHCWNVGLTQRSIPKTPSPYTKQRGSNDDHRDGSNPLNASFAVGTTRTCRPELSFIHCEDERPDGGETGDHVFSEFANLASDGHTTRTQYFRQGPQNCFATRLNCLFEYNRLMNTLEYIRSATTAPGRSSEHETKQKTNRTNSPADPP